MARATANIDEFMQDWRTMFCGQHRPTKLKKIHGNIVDLQEVLKPSDTLLDVGCNIGEMYLHIGALCSYMGIDLFEDHVRQARARHPGIDVRCADLFKLRGKWDIVLCSRVLMHVAPLAKAMKRLLAAARKRLVLFVPIDDEDSCERYRVENDEYYFRRFSEQTLRAFGDCTVIRRAPYSTVIYER